MRENTMSEPESRAPRWAEQVRHPDPHTTEFWRQVGSVTSSDANEALTLAVVQNGFGEPVQILVAGMRFTLTEATELVADALTAIRIAQRATPPHTSDS
jgi:hypothetical protein